MALNPEYVGRVYGPGAPYEVSRVKIADFANAIGEPSELCRDRDAAVKAGRDLRWDDWGGSKKLCLVNEALVNEYLGGANAVGRLVSDMRTLDDQLNTAVPTSGGLV